jgi:hypothetical protein
MTQFLRQVGATAVVGALAAPSCSDGGAMRDSPVGKASSALSANWGLLAGPTPTAMRGVYFFAGDLSPVADPNNEKLYFTTHSENPTVDYYWQTHASQVVGQIAATGANTIVAPYFGHDNYAGRFADVTAASYDLLWQQAVSHSIKIMPSLEYSKNCNVPIAAWDITCSGTGTPYQFSIDISNAGGTGTANRIAELVNHYLRGQNGGYYDSNTWAQLIDQNGTSRYAVAVLHASAMTTGGGWTTSQFVAALESVAAQVSAQTQGVHVGFTLDTWCDFDTSKPPTYPYSYCLSSSKDIDILAASSVILGIQDFGSEIQGFGAAKAYAAAQMLPTPYIQTNGLPPFTDISVAKKSLLRGWVSTGIPTFLDVSPGYDANKVFSVFNGNPPGCTAPLDPTCRNRDVMIGDSGELGWDASDKFLITTTPIVISDDWRNVQAEFKGHGIKGVVADSWNGFTEGMAFADTGCYSGLECNSPLPNPAVKRNWLTDFFSVDPTLCDEVFYSSGVATPYRVYGSIGCRYGDPDVGGQLGVLGQPTGVAGAASTPNWAFQPFQNGRIYWSGATGAKVTWGGIWQSYWNIGADAVYGPPSTDVILIQPGVSAYEEFTYSTAYGTDLRSLYWGACGQGPTGTAHAPNSACAVYGAIYQQYKALGGATGWLGLPTTDEYTDWAGHRRVDFQGGPTQRACIWWDGTNTYAWATCA